MAHQTLVLRAGSFLPFFTPNPPPRSISKMNEWSTLVNQHSTYIHNESTESFANRIVASLIVALGEAINNRIIHMRESFYCLGIARLL